MPLLDNFEEFIDNLYTSFSNYEDILNKLYRQDSRIEDRISKLSNQIIYIENTVFTRAVEFIQERGREIFLDETRKALKIAVEYDYPAFRDRLFNLVGDNRFLTVRQTELGGQVNFNMNIVAGTINEWIEGIEFARKILRKDSPGKPMPEPAASKIWAEKIYGVNRENKKVTRLFKVKGKKRRVRKDITEKYVGKYQKTIELRLSSLATQAPFWPIIEYGSSFMSGKGGTAYPTFEATRFVEKSRIKTQKEFDEYYSSYYSRLLQDLNTQIKQLDRYRKDISREINNVNRIIDDLTRESESKGTIRRIDVAVSLIEEYLTKERKVMEDTQTIRESVAVERILAGDPTRSYVGGTRVRLIELSREFQDRISNYIYEGYDIE